jgi:hypothetical protein
LNYLLKKFKSPRSLSYLALLFDSNFPKSFTVTKEFSNFLFINQEEIKKNKHLKKYYTRADEPLRENENIPKEKLRPIIEIAKRKFSTYKAEQKTSSFDAIQCNYDLNKYRNKVFNIRSQQTNSLNYGLSKNGKSAILTVSNRIDFKSQVKASIFFPSHPLKHTPAVCLKSERHKEIWIISSNSRDPAQHLTNMINNDIFSAFSKNDVDIKVRSPRLLFLEKPHRAVYESERSQKQHRNKLLELGIPLYNSARLGGIISYFKNKNDESFILDDRSDNSITGR